MRIFVLLLLLTTACSQGVQPPKAPDDLIGRDTMVIVMRELVVLESFVESRYQNVNFYYKVMRATGKNCLKKYHIRPVRFQTSYAWYVSRPAQLQSIYSEVLDSLSKEVNTMSLKADTTISVSGFDPLK